MPQRPFWYVANSPNWPETVVWDGVEDVGDVVVPALFTTREKAEALLRELEDETWEDIPPFPGEELATSEHLDIPPDEVYAVDVRVLAEFLEESVVFHVTVDGEVRSANELLADLAE